MAPRKGSSSDSDSDSGSDVPEAIPLSQSKKQIQKLENSRQNAVLAERQNRKTQNRERDRKLKERAEKNKGLVKGATKTKGKGKEKEDDEDEEDAGDDDEEKAVDGLEARMLRAMKDAQDEDDGEDDGDSEGFEGVQLDEDDDESGSQDSEEDSSEEDGSEEDGSEEDGSEEEANDDDEESQNSDEFESELEVSTEPPSKSNTSAKFNPDHLPDELFEAAFASQKGTKRAFTDDTDISSKSKTPSHTSKKRKANSTIPKDVVVGSRAIRVLPSSKQPPAPSTLPSRKIKHFLDRTLALKGGKQRARGWERRPANIGVLRTEAGPAANFVRNR